MKRIISLALFAVCYLSFAYTQSDPKVVLKLSGGSITNVREIHIRYEDETIPEWTWIKKNKVPHFRLGAGYLFNDELEVGLYAGISYLSVPMDPNDIYSGAFTATYSYFYGVELNYHLLPLLLQQPSRFDVNGTCKIGMIRKKWDGGNNEVFTDNFFETGIGIGTAYYITRSVGLFGEVLVGRFYYSNFNWRCGLSFRF